MPLTRLKSVPCFEDESHTKRAFRVGDHLVIRRSTYYHHGIYIGRGMVVHKVAGDSTLVAALFSKNISVYSCGGGVVCTDMNGFAPVEDLHKVQVMHSIYKHKQLNLHTNN